jgi:RNA polymerase sigma-70 factor (ECF subfamily)
MMTDLEENIRKCIKGDRKAQAALYRQFSSKMYGVCLRYSRDSAEAEDNLQEGFVRVFTRIEQFEFKGSFEGWIRRIMVNTALEKYRKKSPLHLVEDLVVYEGTTLVEETLSSISAEDLLKMIQQLPPRYRMVFNLYAIEGYSHQEIGTLMNISEGTSKSNLCRARMILQKRIIKEYGLQENTVKTILC